MLGLGLSFAKQTAKVFSYVKDSLKAYFRFYDTTPDFLLDGSTSFDGSNDYIQLASDGRTDFANQSFTISAWVKFDTVDADHTIFSYDFTSHANPYYACHLRLRNTEKFMLAWNDGSSDQNLTSTSTYSANTWYHIACTFTSGSQKMYVNGSLEVSSTRSDTITYYAQEVWIGKTNNGWYMDGEIANVGIWDRSLSASEIESIQWRGSHSELKDTELTNLVSWYDLDSTELVGSNLITNGDMEADSSWSTSSSASTNERSTEQVYVGTYSRKFVPTSTSDGIQSATITTEISTYTVSFWVYLTNGTELYYAIRRGDAGGWGTEVDATGLTTNAWNYLTTTYTDTTGGSSGYMRITSGPTTSGNFYIDEVSLKKVQSSDFAGSNNGTIIGVTTNTDSYSGESPFKPRIQDKANPKMAVQLSEGSTSFDGSNDSIYFSTPTSANWTFSVWAKADFTDANWHELYDQTTTGNDRMTISVHSNVFKVYDTDYRNSTYTLSDLDWHHYVITQTGTTMTFYVDGSSYGSVTSAGNDLGSNARLGSGFDGTAEFWDGSMANVAIYSSALTQTQVQELMFTEKYSGLRTDLGSELVTNGDMESGDPPSNFSATQSTLDKETTIKHGGSSSLSITHTGGNGMAYQDVTVVSGETYQAKAWVYIASSSAVSNVRMWVNSTAGIGSDLSGDSVITTTKDTWVELTLIFTATTTLARIQIRLDQDGEVFADDISLQKLGEDDTRQGLVSWYDLGSTNVGSEINTLSNASSPTNETNATTGWTNANYETFNSQTEGSEPSGSFSIYLSGSSDKYAHESFTVKVGVVYSIEIVYKTVGNVNVLIGTGEAGNEYSGNIRNKADWFTDTQSITATGTSLFISFQNVGVAQIYVDTLSIKESAIIADNQGSNNGSIYGATTTTGYTSSPHGVVDPLNYGEVYSGRALDFDGTNDYVSVPDDNSLSFGDGSNDSAMSISAWIKTDDVTDFEIVSKGVYSTSGEYRFLISSNDSLYLSLYNGNDSLYEIAYTTSTLKAHEGQWTHVVCTYNGVGGTSANTGIKLYVNGTSQSLTLLSYGSYDAMENSSTDLMIGRHSSAYSEGLINNLKIFSAELTQAQIQQLFTAPETVLPTGVSASNLKLDLPMQEGSGSYIYDGSIRVGSELVVNGDMELDSNWGDVVDPAINERSTEIVRTGTYSRKIVGDSSYDGMAQAITVVAGESYLVSGWVYGDGTNKLYARAYDGGGSGYDNFWIGSSNDGIVVPAEWTYYEKIFKAVGTTFTIQILQGDTSAGGVTFYADDISLKNVTGGQNHGTISGATWATGQEYGYQSSLVRSNTPMIFDGSDDYVSIADSSSFDPGTGDFSLSLWFNNTGNDGAVNTLVFRRADSGTYDGWNAYIATDGTPRFQLDGDAQVNISATGDVGADGKWHHYLVSCDRSGNADVYIDGSLNVSADITSANNSINVTAPIYIGQNNGNSARFAGLINEFAIWDVALDADAVTALYGSGTPLLPTSDSGNYDNSDDLQGYWRNDGNTTWTDRSTNSNNGTVSDTSVASIVIPEGSTSDRDSQGFLLSDTTSITNGIRLHGSEHISIQDSEVLSFGDGTDDKPFSIEAWIKMDDAKNFAILSKGAYGSDGEYYFAVNSSDKLFFELYDDSVSSTWETAMYNTALTSYKGQWIHVCGTYDGRGGTSANAGVKLYLNGSSVATTLSDGGTYVAMENLSQSINIGKRQTSMADGLIDEVRIYSKELSASEVTKNYNNGKSAHQ